MGLTFILVVLLAGAWAALLVPDLRGRASGPRRSSSNNSVKSFHQQLSVLDRSRPVGKGGERADSRPAQRSNVRPDARRAKVRPDGAQAMSEGSPGLRAPVRPGGRELGSARVVQRPANPMVPTSSTAAAQRRLAVLVVLLALAAITLAATFIISRAFLFANLAVDAVLVTYGCLLWNRAPQINRQRRSALTTLPTRRSAPLAVEDNNVMPLRARAKGA